MTGVDKQHAAVLGSVELHSKRLTGWANLTPGTYIHQGRQCQVSQLPEVAVRRPCSLQAAFFRTPSNVAWRRFMTIPDMLKNAPMFKRIDPKYKVSPGAMRASLPCRVHPTCRA